jgi:hypothetical protein
MVDTAAKSIEEVAEAIASRLKEIGFELLSL